MVHQYFDNFDCFASLVGVPRPKKKYPSPPPQVRLQHWLQRVFPNSAFMRGNNGKCRTECKLKPSLANALGLPDCIVAIDCQGKLWHDSREKPLAVYLHNC